MIAATRAVFLLSFCVAVATTACGVRGQKASLSPERTPIPRLAGRPTGELGRISFSPLVVRVSAESLRALFERSLDLQLPVREFVLGTDVHGNSRVSGAVTIQLAPNRQRAEFVAVLTGTASSRTVGYNGPAVIYSRSTTTFKAAKRIAFDADGDITVGRTVVQAETSLAYEGFGSALPRLRGRLVRAVARRRAAQSHQQAQAITNTNTSRQIAEAFDRSFEADLRRYKLDAIAGAAGAFRSSLRVCTTAECLDLRWGACSPTTQPFPAAARRPCSLEICLRGPVENKKLIALIDTWAAAGKAIRSLTFLHPRFLALLGPERWFTLLRVSVSPVGGWIVLQVGSIRKPRGNANGDPPPRLPRAKIQMGTAPRRGCNARLTNR